MDSFQEIESQFKLVGKTNYSDKSNKSVQRTDDWFEKRLGNFTGSKLKDLMGCGRSSAKLSWNDVNKVYDFGSKAERYIYEVGMARKTGYSSQRVSSKEMEWGKDNEDEIVANLIKDGVITEFKESDYVAHPTVPHLGASPDGEVGVDGVRMGAEIKCCVSWAGHFNRMYKVVDEKHDDFWQFQGEMEVLKVKKLLYVVAFPMVIHDYNTQIIDISPIHIKALIQRVQISNAAIELWSKYPKPQALAIAIANFKDENNDDYEIK